MNCKEFIENLNDFIAGQANTTTRQTMEHHLEQCDNCRREADLTLKLLSELKEMDVPDPGSAYWDSNLEKISMRLKLREEGPKISPLAELLRKWFEQFSALRYATYASLAAIVFLSAILLLRTRVDFENSQVEIEDLSFVDSDYGYPSAAENALDPDFLFINDIYEQSADKDRFDDDIYDYIRDEEIYDSSENETASLPVRSLPDKKHKG
jgi:hypothetical protein